MISVPEQLPRVDNEQAWKVGNPRPSAGWGRDYESLLVLSSWLREDIGKKTNLSQQGEKTGVRMGSDAVLVGVFRSRRVVRQTEAEHRRLKSFLEEVLLEVEGCCEHWKQGESERLHGCCIT